MKTRGSIATAMVLIATGVWFLLIELSPAVKEFAYGSSTWPIPIMGIGGIVALIALLAWTPGLMIPATIITGVGGLLYWQNMTGAWETWSYAWALIIVFVGVGILLSGLLSRDGKAVSGGGWTIFNGLVMFLLFGAFLGRNGMAAQLWPLALVAFGIILLGRGLLRRR